MDGNDFDQYARTFARIVTRRGVLAAAGALAAGFAARSARAAQLAPSTCGAEGQVCTLLMGCCSGFTCATSVINTNYGVCVPGDGGTVTVGTTLISPGSEEAAQEVAALATDATTSTSSTTTTDPEADREARQAEKQARKTDRKNKQQTRRNSRKSNRETQRNARLLRRGPKLELQLFKPAAADDPEVVKVTNRDDVAVVLAGISSLLRPTIESPLSPTQTRGAGSAFLFLSGVANPELGLAGNQFGWTTGRICSDAEVDDGFVVTAGLTSDLENHEYVIYCDRSSGSGKRKRKSKKRENHRQHSRARKKK
jgi:hypothetical protein